MKRLISVLLILLTVLTVCASCEKKDDNRVEMQSAEDVEAKIGGKFLLPKSVKYPTFFVVDEVVGESQFAFNGFIFTYYASKIRAGASLHGKEDSVIGTSKLTIDSRAELTVNSYADGSRLATWIYSGTNYALYTEKSASDDVFTELCDLLIR